MGQCSVFFVFPSGAGLFTPESFLAKKQGLITIDFINMIAGMANPTKKKIRIL